MSYLSAGIGCAKGLVRMAKILGHGLMVAGDVYQAGKAVATGDMGAIALQVFSQAAGKIVAKSTGRSNACFVAGTQVLTDSGPRNIEEIRAGDQVWSLHEDTGEPGFKPVVETYVREASTLVHLTYRRVGRAKGSAVRGMTGGDADDGDGPATLTGTQEHPFWSLSRNQWVAMGELAIGERLRLDDGEAVVTALQTEDLQEPVNVYNFHVAEHRTYFVAPHAHLPFAWVHNRCKDWQNLAKEADAGGGHSFADHGAHVTPDQHLKRLQTGNTPSGRMAAPPPASSSFSTHKAQVLAHDKAWQALWSHPDLITKGNFADKIEFSVRKGNAIAMKGAGFSYRNVGGKLSRTKADSFTAVFRLVDKGTPVERYVLKTMYPDG